MNRIYYANTAFQDTLIHQELLFSFPAQFLSEPNLSLVINELGAAHLAFRGDLAGPKVQYVFNSVLNQQDWNNLLVDTPSEVEVLPKLTVGPEGRIHIAVMGFDEGSSDAPEIYYANREANNSPNWGDFELVDEDQLGELSSISVDPNGVVHVGINATENGEALGNFLVANTSADEWQVDELIEDDVTFQTQLHCDNIGQLYAFGIKQVVTDTTDQMDAFIFGNTITDFTEIPEPVMEDSSSSALSSPIQLDWSFYPNPTSKELLLQYPANSVQNEWSIQNLTGQTIAIGRCALCSKEIIDLAKEKPGFYILSLNSDGVKESRKLLIAR